MATIGRYLLKAKNQKVYHNNYLQGNTVELSIAGLNQLV